MHPGTLAVVLLRVLDDVHVARQLDLRNLAFRVHRAEAVVAVVLSLLVAAGALAAASNGVERRVRRDAVARERRLRVRGRVLHLRALRTALVLLCAGKAEALRAPIELSAHVATATSTCSCQRSYDAQKRDGAARGWVRRRRRRHHRRQLADNEAPAVVVCKVVSSVVSTRRHIRYR